MDNRFLLSCCLIWLFGYRVVVRAQPSDENIDDPRSGGGRRNSGRRRPTPVYILAGQSNMAGQGSITHLQALLDDPVTAPLYRHLQYPNGTWVVRDDVFVQYNEDRLNGSLTVGFGEPLGKGNFGPELQFGHVLGNATKNRVIYLIKAAWGGASLAADFRPPSSGLPSVDFPRLADSSVPCETCEFGWRYHQMISIINLALEKLPNAVPDYNPEVGYELEGFLWLQGFNDVLDVRALSEYGANLGNFIRDVREALDAPGMPFYIGELGMQGIPPKNTEHIEFREIQRQLTEEDEFVGNVFYVRTAIYAVIGEENIGEYDFDGPGSFHYNGRADTVVGIGQGFADVVLGIEQPFPTATPTESPIPSSMPSSIPSTTPSAMPSDSISPSMHPSSFPSSTPSDMPSTTPSDSPRPSASPTESIIPSGAPTPALTDEPTDLFCLPFQAPCSFGWQCCSRRCTGRSGEMRCGRIFPSQFGDGGPPKNNNDVRRPTPRPTPRWKSRPTPEPTFRRFPPNRWRAPLRPPRPTPKTKRRSDNRNNGDDRTVDLTDLFFGGG